MHLHWVSRQETTEGDVNPSRFVNSAKIHPFQYIYLYTIFPPGGKCSGFPYSELLFKKHQVGLSLLSNVSSHGGSSALPLPPMTSWGLGGMWVLEGHVGAVPPA